MLRQLAKFLFRRNGWRLDNSGYEDLRRYVLISAPHTSNWDFIYGLAAYDLLGVDFRFTIKKEWVRFPLKGLFLRLGAIGIDRRPKRARTGKNSLVHVMAELFEDNEELVIAVTPEGTRSKVTRWKTGFYQLAVQAKVPIALGYLDYERCVAGVGKVIYPSGDMKKDMCEIMAFYQHIPPRYPEKFSVDLRYIDDNE